VAQTELALTGIALMLTVIPGIFHFLVGAIMLRYRITDEAYRTLLAELLVRS
jgi:GPH family glycoside/pentoside/hexuronide:cation symporter